MSGQLVFIEVVPNDAEARRAALNIARTLKDAKWNLQKPSFSEERIEDGVSVQPSHSRRPGINGQSPDMTLSWKADERAEVLLDFLHSYNWQASRGFPLDAQNKLIRDPKILAEGAIRIQVGLYPPVIYVSPQDKKLLMSAWRGLGREGRNYKQKLSEKLRLCWKNCQPTFGRWPKRENKNGISK